MWLSASVCVCLCQGTRVCANVRALVCHLCAHGFPRWREIYCPLPTPRWPREAPRFLQPQSRVGVPPAAPSPVSPLSLPSAGPVPGSGSSRAAPRRGRWLGVAPGPAVPPLTAAPRPSRRMRSRPVLAALLVLALPLALARRPPAPPGPAAPAQGMPVPEPLPWRFPGAAYAALLQLLRGENAGPSAPAAPQKRDMHDFFVGLMGKRAAEPGRPAGRGSGGSSPRCSPGPPAAGGAPLRAV
ncbi:tachykinin-3 isoform X2 [Patagioenas fasciata]|uniref:tachykinin-3 isoform X2 n=1 Tax=Patagioenas fasciata TaxID=372321 RepID=UPI003A990BFF